MRFVHFLIIGCGIYAKETSSAPLSRYLPSPSSTEDTLDQQLLTQKTNSRLPNLPKEMNPSSGNADPMASYPCMEHEPLNLIHSFDIDVDSFGD